MLEIKKYLRCEMTKIEKIIQMNKKKLCSSLIGNTVYNGKQIREWCGEVKSNKKTTDFEFKTFLASYLPTIQSFLNGKNYPDNQLLGNGSTVISVKKLKYFLNNNIPFMLHYHAYGLNGADGHIIITYIRDNKIITEEFTRNNMNEANEILSNSSYAKNFTYEEFEESIDKC